MVSHLLERAEAERLSVETQSHLYKQLRKGKGHCDAKAEHGFTGGHAEN